MIPSPVRRYRMTKIGEIRSRKLYSGYLHYGFTAGFALGIGMISFSKIQEWSPRSLLLIPLIVIYANFVEYFTHRWPLHRRIKGLGLLYERHGVQHHSYFNHREMTIQTHREMYYVLFPAQAIVLFIALMAGPLSWGMGRVLGPDQGWLTLGSSVFYFAWYETVHLANHLPRNHFIHLLPGLTRLCEFHRIHHEPGLSRSWNFNVTFPLADWVMGTLKNSPIKTVKKP